MNQVSTLSWAAPRRFGVGVFVLAFLPGCGSDVDATPQTPFEPLSDAQVKVIKEAVDASLGQGLATGYSLAVWRDGAVIYTGAWGTRDEQGNPVTAETLFQIGSDTKKITAIGVLQQVHAGVLTLSQTLDRVLPGLALASSPAHFESLTLHDLLCQRSGLYDYTPWVERPRDSYLAEVAFGRFAENEPVMMPAGIAFNYSNPNYALAGLAYEVAVGEPWADAIQANVFEKLDMRHSYARRDDMLAAEADVASGHGAILPGDWDPFEPREDDSESEASLTWVEPAAQPDDAFTRPAGLVWSTAADQARLLGFLLDGDPKVLPNELREELLTPHAPWYNHVDLRSYGYGMMVDRLYQGSGNRFYAIPSYAHGGATLTMTSSSAALPEQRVAVSILANGAAENLQALTAIALEVAAEGRLPAPSPPPMPPEPRGLETYAGTYFEPTVGEVTLTWEDGSLRVDIPGLAELGIPYEREPVAVARDLFLFTIDGEPYPVSFYDDVDGTPHRYGVNRQFVLTRSSL